MNWRTGAALTLLVVGAAGCDKIPFLGKKKAADTTQVAAADTAHKAAPAPADTAAAPAPAPKMTAPAAHVARTDMPWTPRDTGTVDPGMSRDQVIATWGPPVAERANGPWTYLYFRNGCEVSCGTFDVVFLDSGQVVDAIVRGQGHHYSGVSSSPPDRKASPTLPGTTTGTQGQT